MGAWGHGSFSNDSALDWLSELAGSAPTLLSATLAAVAVLDGNTYLEVDESSAALAAAELVAAAHGHGDERLSEDALAWLNDHRDAARAVTAEQALSAVKRVYENSELRELWDENGDDTKWHAEVRGLLQRLGS